MKEIVFIGENNQALTNSLLVAEKFGKEPNDVVRAIDNLLQNADNECSAKVQNMFVEYTEDVPQPNGGVKTAKRFIMNRDGFTLLAMGFTGKRVLKFKLEYIAAFNEMEKMINGGGGCRTARAIAAYLRYSVEHDGFVPLISTISCVFAVFFVRGMGWCADNEKMPC